MSAAIRRLHRDRMAAAEQCQSRRRSYDQDPAADHLTWWQELLLDLQMLREESRGYTAIHWGSMVALLLAIVLLAWIAFTDSGMDWYFTCLDRLNAFLGSKP